MTETIADAARYIAHIVFALVALCALALPQAAPAGPMPSPDDTVIHDENRPAAHIIFATASPPGELQSLFSSELIAELRQIDAGVALSIDDLSPDRAQLVRRLNAAGIPVVAVIVLGQQQGYYVNADNADATVARFSEFDKWSTENQLRWESIGLDIEPSLKDWSAINGHKLRFAGMVLRRLMQSNRSVYRSRSVYSTLIQRMQSRGYFVQTYQLPLIVGERAAHSTTLEKLLGLVDVRGNQEVLMLYTSFNPALGSAMIWEYGPHAQAIAIGSTAGAQVAGRFSPLDWDQFARDLIVARHFSNTIGVYSLEGCISNGYLSRLKTMDWNRSVSISGASINKAARMERVICAVLWISRFWMLVAVFFFLFVVWSSRWMIRRLTRKTRV